MQPLHGIRPPCRLPLAHRKAREREQSIPGLLQAVRDRPALQPPLAQERLAPLGYLGRARGVDHVRVVGRDLLMQPLGRVGQKVAVLVNRAALERNIGPQRRKCFLQAGGPIHDDELGCLQATGREIVEQRAPSRLALPAHVLDREQDLLPVTADAKDHQERDRGGLAVEPDAHDRAVENEADNVLPGQRTPAPRLPVGLHLAPDPADHVLADRAAKQRRKRTTNPPCVGAGQIGPGDQRLGAAGQALVSRQGGVLPLARAALGVDEPGSGYAHRHGAEGAQEAALAMTVAIAGRGGGVRTGLLAPLRTAPLVALATERGFQLGFEQGLDEGADTRAHARFERIEPILAEKAVRLGRVDRVGYDMAGHGVISAGLPRPVWACGTSRRLRRLQIPTITATAPESAVPVYYKRYLEPHRERLAARASIVQGRRQDWWGLMRPRGEWSFSNEPRIISKFFAAEGGFVGDYEASYLVVM